MPRPMKIEFVSDISCPFCAIGLHGLELALAEIGDVVDPQLHFEPFELNPDMPAGGQSIVDNLAEKYGNTSAEQSAAGRDMLRAQAAELGFVIDLSEKSRMYNTFDAHRLLHWSEQGGRQQALKHALFEAYFSNGEDPSDHDVLVACAEQVGLDGTEARDMLASDRYAHDVRQAEYLWQARGVTGVPAIVIDGRHLISGAHPPAAYARAIRQIAAQPA